MKMEEEAMKIHEEIVFALAIASCTPSNVSSTSSYFKIPNHVLDNLI